ncbi:hydrolase 2, exosortase A system-associated [Roseateles terrae]|uniref:Exosortase A-associated hydrolase 2 n=1 Tax=Roseateles terrae TaxID=431060 RepID=A0ABR6GN10_9BURK|nr:hydrolase 2, exosortase A system-associated [Roseateles terrae]MBB3193496.1 exosortase A-associated hydrolase 2 [Roseateles terrae]OWQ89329.1 hydrolase 2, exosortase A system-associated [Roseateles terrae]
MTAACRSFFLDAGPRGQRLCVFYAAQGVATPVGQVLLLPPFGEELNKSRRMLALGSRALAAAGFDVLMMDLLGCGDSSGDFGDATWGDWNQDMDLAIQWLATRPAPLWLWGVRAGALLVPAALEAAGRPVNLLLWQPVTAGKLQLQQFLRLKVAADLVGGQAKGAMQALRSQLDQGQPVEIAGYQLSPALAAGLEQAQLKPPAVAGGANGANGVDVATGFDGVNGADGAHDAAGDGRPVHRVVWLETSLRDEPALSPAGASASQAWAAAGCDVHARAVKGLSFWAATEIEVAPDLIAASVQAMLRTTTPTTSTEVCA